ncbi:MAG: hypothetical protein L0196_03050 [candidate division Zixibacteria bacterium]|nr:hypothetical protein [candidate division Zixibacteria bacterium]
MNPSDLIGPSSSLGSPAPYWFLVFFKILGFVLHIIPMSLWYAGIILALLVRWKGGENGRIWSGRLMKQMPLLVALGVNFGIVPLLFTQVSYYQVFYPATILMAWFWLSVILLLTLAYYGVYIYAYGLKEGNSGLTPFRQAAAWIAAIFFIVIGFLFSNAFSLMTNLGGWPALAEKTGEAGAVLGTALNTGDSTLWARWLMMFGLALTTTGAYAYVDAGVFGRKESEKYRLWAGGFALKIYTLGAVWFALFGSWYVFGTWQEEVKATMFAMPLGILTVLTAVSPGLVWFCLWFFRKSVSKRAAFFVALTQLVVLSLNAVSRQIVQNLELGKFLDVTAEPVKMQLSPIVLFLLLFVFGIGVVVWMVRKVIAVETRPAAG